MGWNRQYYGGPKLHDDMRVPDELKNSVCFICGKKKRARVFKAFGTGFFVAVPGQDAARVYLVTAKHVLDDAKAEGYRDFHLRVNTVYGDADFLSLPDRWTYPRVPESGYAVPDVAVLEIYESEIEKHMVIAAIPVQYALGDEAALQSHNVGIGDDVLLIGLFRHRHGVTRNIPIVRGGILAAMPEEPLAGRGGKLFDGYLIEIRSISGLSGSPVIVFKQEPNSTAFRMLNKLPDLPIMFTNGYLLGLVRGHWSAENIETADSLTNDDSEPLNTGIAIVTPIREALSIINREELAKGVKAGGQKGHEVLD